MIRRGVRNAKIDDWRLHKAVSLIYLITEEVSPF